tara:strand:+ start:110 stop:265 length:156 start_codon:yes stop_codon:yes gene_type:complete
MKKLLERIQKHPAKAEASLNKITQTNQVLAEIDASLIRSETQKVIEKVQNK